MQTEPTLTKVEISRRGTAVFEALTGLDGPQAFAVLLSALMTTVKSAPSGQRAMLRTAVANAVRSVAGA